jgi:hypothetical protein
MLKRACVFWIGAAIFGLAIGLPFAFAFSQFHHSALPSHRDEGNHATEYVAIYRQMERENYLEKVIDPLAISTFVLCVITGTLAWYTRGLFGATARLASDADKASRESARISAQSAAAAEKSASVAEKALTLLERPFVYGGIPQTKEGNILASDVVRLVVYNFGRTPAYLTRIEYEMSVEPTGSIIKPIDPFTNGGRELPVGTIADKNDPHSEPLDIANRVEGEGYNIVHGKKSMWLTGFARYDDIFGTHYITGFTLVFDIVGERFVRHGSDAYNYTRVEKEADIPPPSSNS